MRTKVMTSPRSYRRGRSQASEVKSLGSIALTSSFTYTFLRYTVVVILAGYVLLQARKPDKWFGRIIARAMNKGHESMTDWGLSHVAVESRFVVLDVGCGGGRTIEKLAGIATGGTVYGIDYAEGSIAVCREHNAPLIKAGRVVIQNASVSRLPFPNDIFDLVTAIETQYYWPDVTEDMREILRVLKPAGRLVVIAEMYKGGKYYWLKWPVMWLLRSTQLSVSDHREMFTSAGYVNVEVFEHNIKGWICAMAAKPARKS
jgi:SAM-dependent methyltransferase